MLRNFKAEQICSLWIMPKEDGSYNKATLDNKQSEVTLINDKFLMQLRFSSSIDKANIGELNNK